MTAGTLLEDPRPSSDTDPAQGSSPTPPPGPAPGAGAIPVALLAAAATLLTSTALTRVFEGFAWWFVPAVGAVLTVTVCGILARLARLPLLLMPVAYALGLILYVPAVSAPTTRVALLPTGSTLTALSDLLGVGSEDVRRLAVPVPERPGLVLLLILGVYAVACAVDVICTRLESPATAGLPLLALLAVPAAIVPGDVGRWPFVAGAVGYLALLAVGGRHAMTDRAGPTGLAPAGPGAGGRARGLVPVAVVALLAALLLPVVLPGPGRGLFAAPEGDATGLGGGDGRARVVQPFVTLDQQLRSNEIVDLMRVRTDTPEYLRLTALEIFDGSRFSLGRLQADPQARVSNGLPAPDAGVPTVEASADIRVRDVYRQRYLPVPYSPTAISISGDWRLFRPTTTVFSGRTDTGGTRYSYTAQVPAPTAAALREEPAPNALPNEIAVNLRLPGLDNDVVQLARQLTADAPTTYDKVAAIQAYLRSPAFTYDLDGAPRNGRDALETFLLDTRRGYCEQFASAMAVLTRAINVPARVAIGFTPGTRNSDGDWVITNRDAHAWPEVWFPNSGWVRFEPTPRDDSTEVPPDYSVPPPPGTTGLEAEDPSSALAEPVGPGAEAPPLPGELADPSALGGSSEEFTEAGSSRSWGWLIGGGAAVLAALVVAGPAALRLLRRRRRLRDGSTALWREVSDTATDLGLAALPTESPRAAGRRWQEHVGDSADGRARTALAELARREEQSRYGSVPVAARGSGAPSVDDARLAVDALEQASSRRDRLRAWVLPRSSGRLVSEWSSAQRQSWRRLLPRVLRRKGEQPA